MTQTNPGSTHPKRLIAGLIVLFAMFAAVTAGLDRMAQDAHAEGNGTSEACTTGLTGSGTVDSMSYTAAEGKTVSSVCIKSGENMFGGNQHSGELSNGTFENGCYTVSGVGTATVNVTRNFGSSSCQELSHIDAVVTGGVVSPETPAGSITIVKQGLTGDAAATFTQNIDLSGDFVLSAGNNSKLFAAVEADTYTVVEAPVPGYTLVSAGCALANSTARSQVQTVASGNTLNITLVEGQNLICTFVNAPAQVIDYTVTIKKYVDGVAAVAADGTFNFTANWDEPDMAPGSGNFALNAGNSFSATTSPLGAGSTYSIVENGIDATCGPEDDYRLAGFGIGATLQLALDAAPVGVAAIANLQANTVIVVRNISCDVPAETGSITIVKQGLLGEDTATFTHDVNGGGTFTLSAGDNQEVIANLNAGVYTFIESPVPGYTLVSAGCALANARSAQLNQLEGNTLEVTLTEGQDLICTFVNAQAQEIAFDVTIEKYVDGAIATEGEFNFTANWDEPDADPGSGGFALNISNDFTAKTSPLAEGSSYSIVENGIDATCNSGDEYRLVGYGIGVDLTAALAATATLTASIDSLDSNLVIVVRNETCEFDYTVTIHKYVDGVPAVAADGSFNFTANFDEPDAPAGSGNFDLNSGNSFMAVTSPLGAGSTYSATENNINATCDAGDQYRLAGYSQGANVSAAALTLPTAQGGAIADLQGNVHIIVWNVTCEYTVTITKYVDGELATDGMFNFDASWQEPGQAAGNGSFSLPNNGSYSISTSSLDFGSSYSVAETGIDGTCSVGDEYRLIGYTIGETAVEAAASLDILDAGSILELDSNLHIIVWNEACDFGSITIVKIGLQGSDTAEFEQDINASGNFSLSASDNEEVFLNLVAGTYTVTELELEGYTLVSAGCSLALGRSSVALEASTSLAIVLAEGQDLVCTFVNGAAAEINYTVTITKYLDGAEAMEGDGPFDFTSTWMEPNEAEGTGNFSLNFGNQFTAVTSPLGAGSEYSFVENNIDGTCGEGDEYRLVGFTMGETAEEAAASTDIMPTVSIDDLQSNLHIIVWNESCEAGSITIIKAWNGGTAVDTSFTTSVNLGVTGNSIELTGASDTYEFTALDDGTYIITEVDLEGWTLTSIFCSNHVPNTFGIDLSGGMLTINLGDDHDVTCTFTNTANPVNEGTGTVTIIKNWVGGTAVTTNFTTSVNLGATGNAFALNGTTTQMMFDELGTGTYVVTESDMTGWTLTSIVCGNSVPSTFGIDLTGGELTINLGDDDDVTCTFTNTADGATGGTGSVTIIKNWGGADGELTSFTASANLGASGNAFNLNDDVAGNQMRMFTALANGSYTVTETDMAGWTLTAINCTGNTASTFNGVIGTGVLSITLAGNESIVCTFTNAATPVTPGTGSITIIKNWGSGTAVTTNFTASANLGATGNAFALNGTTTQMMFDDLGVATYIVTETALAGWTLSGIACGNAVPGSFAVNLAGGTLTVNLAAGQDITCTFTNTQNAAVSPFTPPIIINNPPNNSVAPPSTNPITNNPGTNPPSVSNPPTVSNPTSVSNPPSVINPPSIINTVPPSAVGNQAPPVTNNPSIISNNSVVGGTPLPPSAGNGSAGPATTPSFILFAGLAIAAGALAVVGYGVTRRS